MWRLYRLANLSVRKRRKVKQVAGERQQLWWAWSTTAPPTCSGCAKP
ncbi:hypothetical protein [Variovorax gossypii]